ncbi:MAG: hypothetical protein Q9184_004672 [Pyrenodesmia sp. 2 TL-2023]
MPTAIPLHQIDVAVNVQRPSSTPSPPLASPVRESKLSIGFHLAPHETRSSPSYVIAPPRTRKRVPWRGKACIISLPTQSTITEYKQYSYLTPREVEIRFGEWRAQGYDIDGFRLGHPSSQDDVDLLGCPAQTRSPFPDAADIVADRVQRVYRVRIPDRTQWDVYVDSVREAKLRKLGVSPGDNDLASRRPSVDHTLSCPSSARGSSLSVSPSLLAPRSEDLLPASGITSQARDLLGSSSGASQATDEGTHHFQNGSVRHFPRYSIVQPYTVPQLSSSFQGLPSDSMASHQRLSGHRGSLLSAARVPSSMPEQVLGMLYTTPDLKEPSTKHVNGALTSIPAGDCVSHTSRQQKVERNQGFIEHRDKRQVSHAGSYPVDARLEWSEDQHDRYTSRSATDIHIPIPRSRRVRIPETLERHLCEAEDDETATQPQPWNDSLHVQNLNCIAASNTIVKSSKSESNLSPDAARSPVSQDQNKQDLEATRTASSLSALAPEFVSGSAVFSFGSSAAGTAMRPTAPAFTPTTVSPGVPASREFSFSSSGPLFDLGDVEARTAPPRVGLADGDTSKGIFGAIQYPLVSKLVKKSKAVPIQKPGDERHNVDPGHEVQEDESGRVTQAEGQQKRLRRSGKDADQDTWLGAPLQESSWPVPQHRTANALEAMVDGKPDHTHKDSMSLKEAVKAADQLKKIIDNLSASEDFDSQEQRAEGEDSEQREHTFPADPEGMTSIKANSCSASRPTAPVPSTLPEEEYVFHARSVEEEQNIYESEPNQALNSPASQPATDTAQLQEYFADSDNLESSHREELSAALSTLHRSSFGISAVRLETAPRLASSSDQENDNEPQTLGTPEGIPDGVSYVEPSYEEINAVLKHLDAEKPQTGATIENSSYSAGGNDGVDALDFQGEDHKVRDAMSSCTYNDAPSIGLAQRTYQYLPQTGSESADSSIVKMVAEHARFSPSYRPANGSKAGPAARCSSGSADSTATSEWDNAYLSTDEARICGRSSFFDAHVNNVVGRVLQDCLAPLEQTLSTIQDSLAAISKLSSGRADRPESLDITTTSDADDEEDQDSSQPRARSPIMLRKFDKLKALMAQVVTDQQHSISANGLGSITEDIKALKLAFEETRPSFAEIKTVVEEAVGKQLRGRSAPITSSHQLAAAEKHQLQIAGLESMLKVAEGRAEDEMKARRATEDALADSQRLLRLALQDAAEQRESSEETERSLSAFYEERHETLRHTAMLEGAQESLQSTAAELAEKNTALEGTLEEYRLSSAQWRSEIESAKIENGDLRRTVTALKLEIDDGIRNRHALRAKFDQLQGEIVQAAQNIAQDQSMWRAKEEDLKAECRLQSVDNEREKQRGIKLENELAALTENLRYDRERHCQVVAQYERDLHDQREMARLEANRMKKLLEDDSTAATAKLGGIRTDSERAIASLQVQLERANRTASTDKERYEVSLRDTAASKVAALKEQQKFHERTMRDLREQHDQVSQIAARERQCVELQFNDQTALAGEKLLFYQDKIRHLEEKLNVARSSAQAAVNATHPKNPPSAVSDWHESVLSDGFPEKTSPQALRESILVLQEQLQDRESTIEHLEQKLSAVDVDAPTKVRAQETEITWLRELLGVRIDDLEDLITALARPVYDQEAIKDAAIRLKANLQMEQQEKERAHSGRQLLAPFSSLSNLTSSPRTLPLAAAAAWGNWRKGFQVPVSHTAETPSRPSPSTQTVSSGLLTPPNTNVRASSQSNVEAVSFGCLARVERSTSNRREESAYSPRTGRSPERASPPMTPSLTRKANYDIDAATADVKEIQDDVKRDIWAEAGDDEPFGPPLADFPGTA